MKQLARTRQVISRGAFATALLLLGACSPAPAVPSTLAAARISAWLPGAEVTVLGSEPASGGAVVEADVSGEALRFRFEHADGAWVLGGMVKDGRTLDQAQSKEAWLEIVRAPRPVSLAEIATGERPPAPLEVVVTPLTVVSIEEERLELESAAEPELGQVVVNGRHFDNLPIEVGQTIGIQLQGLGRDENGWFPERSTLANEIMVELDPIDVTLLALLKLRLADQVIPVPYAIPDMEHDHGDGASH